jgi:hypothetical protein
MHHGGNFENNSRKFVIDDVLCSNLAICCGINAHMNDIIVQHGENTIIGTRGTKEKVIFQAS